MNHGREKGTNDPGQFNGQYNPANLENSDTETLRFFYDADFPKNDKGLQKMDTEIKKSGQKYSKLYTSNLPLTNLSIVQTNPKEMYSINGLESNNSELITFSAGQYDYVPTNWSIGNWWSSSVPSRGRLRYFNGVWIIVSGTVIYKSVDAANWTLFMSPSLYSTRTFDYGNGIWAIALANNQIIARAHNFTEKLNEG